MWRAKRIFEWTSSSSSGQKRKNRNDGIEDDIPGAYDPSNKHIECQDGASEGQGEPKAKRTRRDEPTFTRPKYIRIENTKALPDQSSTRKTREFTPPGIPTDPDVLKTRNALTSTQHQVASLRSQMNSLQKQLSTRTSELQQAISEGANHARRAEALGNKLEETKLLLEARTMELGAAQAFVTTADSVSIADVTRFVEQLNDEVYQVAADLGNTVLENRSPENYLSSYERKFAVESWGDAVVNRLRTDIQKEDTLLFEALVQHTVLAFCLAVVQSLCVSNEQVDEELRLVWDEIRKSTDIALAKNWLALTTKHSTSPPSIKRADTTQSLLNLMVVAGALPSALPVSPNSPNGGIGAQVEYLIVSKALKIREMMNAGVLSAHVELILPSRGEGYDSTKMVDAYENPASVRNAAEDAMEERNVGKEKIVCSTALGITCIPLKNAAAKAGPETVLKPKVLLYSTLERDG
ncbi:hypothetical protein D9611_003543 [Ephemerocybe angulata]|uniref:Uncharacterized protein n=1 Tax=Ephemerocybe angulata TaxID=980116 RepID=A0A8H5B7E4_9AGAR|nr:hypothetical protein D9611_003543 [Tulosesus angulatus]